MNQKLASDRPGASAAPTPERGTESKHNLLLPPSPLPGKAGESTPLHGGWALWAGIAAVLAAVAGWLWLRSKGKKG